MTHSALLIAGGALLTSVLAALLFRPTASPEERHLRDVQRLLRALEAQRRVRDARRRRENRGRVSGSASHPPAIVEAQSTQEAEAEAEPEPVAKRNDRAERRASEQLRRRAEKEQAAALKAQSAIEKRARQELERERKAALEAERAAEKQARRELARERKAALEAERARTEPQPQPEPAPASEVAEEPSRLTELPLYSWATRIENEDRPPTDKS